MARLVEEFKDQFKRQDNGLVQIILINVVVYVIMAIIIVISEISKNSAPAHFFKYYTYLSSNLNNLIYKPWTVFTYFFTHDINPFHILFNMLALYWFGRIIHEFIGNRRLINIYVMGGLLGGIIFLVIQNTVPFFIERTSLYGLTGASGSVYAVAVAAATLVPDYRFFLVFIGPVRIIYIVAIFVFISFISIIGENPGGNICHLGGALLGYLYISQLKKGRDIGQPINIIARWIRNIRKPRMKVSYKKDGDEISQKEVDAILDKINRSGYESLTKEEKQKLYKASQK
jgi:membrane associated rhomboid family serine protease